MLYVILLIGIIIRLIQHSWLIGAELPKIKRNVLLESAYGNGK